MATCPGHLRVEDEREKPNKQKVILWGIQRHLISGWRW